VSFIRRAEALFERVEKPEVMNRVVLRNASLLRRAAAGGDNPLIERAKELKRIAERRDDFLYIVARAISAYETWNFNNNGDGFHREELIRGHHTFRGVGHYVDHVTDRAETVRGIVLDSHWNPPVSVPDGLVVGSDLDIDKGDYVTVLLAIDRKNYPAYADQVERGTANRFSMGVRVARSQCSICGNWAQTERDFCSHIPHLKAMYVGDKLCGEFNYGLTFIELSGVSIPADPTALMLCKVAHALGYDKSCTHCGCSDGKPWFKE